MSRTDTDRRVLSLAGAFAGGLLIMLIAVAVVDSPLIAGLALAWILAVILYARHTLRCPLCGASVLNAGVGKGVSWLAGRDRRCPRCKAGYEEAVSARVRGPVK